MNFNEEKAKLTDTGARKSLQALFDENSFTEIDAFAKSGDGAVEVVAGYGTVEGSPAYAFAQDSTVAGGAIGQAHGAKIKKVYELAAKTGAPVVGLYDSNGARLGEGMDALAAYGDMLRLSNNISGVVPQISVITGVCAGTAAMVAAAADIVIMSEKAELFLTAPDVLKADGQKEETASLEACLKSGAVQLGAKDAEDAVQKAREVLSKLPLNNLSEAPLVEFSEDTAFLSSDAAALKADAAAVVAAIADTGSVLELSADFGKGVKTILATVAGSTVGFVAFTGKAICANMSAKASRFVRFCDAFALPVVTLVHTEGFLKCAKAENAGLLRSVSMLAGTYAEATCPKISLITGEAIGAAYIALAGRGVNADLAFAWPNAVISALEPQAAVAILYQERLSKGESRDALLKEYCETGASVLHAAAKGYVDDVFAPADTRARLIAALEMLSGKRETTLPKKHANFPC